MKHSGWSKELMKVVGKRIRFGYVCVLPSLMSTTMPTVALPNVTHSAAIGVIDTPYFHERKCAASIQ